MNKTNPARRLLDIMRHMKKKPNPSTAGRQVIASYFSINQGENEEVYSKFSKFYTLISESERKIKSIEDPYRDKVLLCFIPIKNHLKSLHIDSPWQTQLNGISESDLGLLEIGADLLDTYFQETEIQETKLKALVEEVNSLDSEIIDSDVDPKVKGIITDLTEGIRRSISDYKLSGVEGLKKILAESFGRLSLDHEIVKTESEKPSVMKFWDILSKINTMISSADTTYKISTKTLELLSGQ